jgi:DNA-binding MarR family transcriptional regulator
MKTTLIQDISEHFMGLMPLLSQHIFQPPGQDEMPLHLTPTNALLLLIVNEMNRSTISVLSQKMCVSRPNMTPLVDKLVQFELVNRIPSVSDRRVNFIEITPKGRLVCKEMHQIHSAKIEKKLDVLELDTLTELNLHLSKLKAILHKLE